MSLFWRIATFVARSVVITLPAMAQEKVECSVKITRYNLVPCVLSASLTVRGEQQTALAMQGKRTAVSSALPSNPVLALTGARRAATGMEPTALDWSATLSQELEIGGQRASRLRAAEAELDAQGKRILMSQRDTAYLAWTAFFDFVAAEREQRLAERLLSASQRMSDVTRAKAEKGLVASVDVDVANAGTLRILQSKLSSDRARAMATARLNLLLGHDTASAPLSIEGDLAPLSGLPDAMNGTNQLLANRPETLIFDADRRAMEARAEAFRRLRIPNPTISIFAQNDGYNERVIGLGISLPIPLPMPIGRTYAGEIAEAEALAHKTQTDRARAEREIRLDAETAWATLTAHRQAVDALNPDMLQRAEVSLRDLGQEIEAGRLSVREAVVAQQTLIDLLQTNIAERRALCLASVDLARALGVALEMGSR